MKINSKIISVVLFAITLLLIEGALRYFTPFPIHAHKANQIDDDILSYRLDASLGGIDSNGFRNAAVPESADIVAVGDSFTYGVNVDPQYSWPNQLAAMTNLTVYNFGVSGYDILQYDHLIDEAIKLNPEYIIVGLYISNDLKVCKLLTSLDYWIEWAKKRGYDSGFCYAKQEKKRRFQLTNFEIINDAMYETAIGSLTTYVWELVSERFSLGTEGQSVVVRNDSNPTIITSGTLSGHNMNMDLTRPEASLGFHIAKDVLIEAKDKLDKKNITLVILFIPSKEITYFDYLEAGDYQLPKAYYDLISRERSLRDKFIKIFDEHDIDYVDAEPYVTEALSESKKVYLNIGDGHPVRAGYEAYAKAVYENIFKKQ